VGITVAVPVGLATVLPSPTAGWLAATAVAVAVAAPPGRVSVCRGRASPGGVTLTSMFLRPVPITAENLSVVVDAGWIGLEALCQGVTGGPAPCN